MYPSGCAKVQPGSATAAAGPSGLSPGLTPNPQRRIRSTTPPSVPGKSWDLTVEAGGGALMGGCGFVWGANERWKKGYLCMGNSSEVSGGLGVWGFPRW